MTTVKEARIKIRDLIANAWQEYPLFWEDEIREVPHNQEPWLRARVQHNLGRQSSLGNFNGDVKYERAGIVFLQLFVPLQTKMNIHDDYVEKLLQIFARPNTTDVWFRNPTFREVGQNGAWFQSILTAEFSYEEVK